MTSTSRTAARRPVRVRSGRGFDLQGAAIFAAAGVAVVICTVAILDGGPHVAVLILVGCFGLASIMAAATNRPVIIIALLVIASAVQRAVAASTLDTTALWLDDIVLIGMMIYVAKRLVADSRSRTKVIVLVILAILAIAAVRSPDLGIGISQFRQMVVPMVLLLFGMVLTRDQIMRAGPVVVGVILVGAVYALFEQLGWRPIDPLGALGLNEYSHANARDGLPASYFYYFADGFRMVRSGGLILNPPSLGMLVAAGFMWVWFTRGKNAMFAVIASIVFLAVAVFSFGRGGFVLLALAVFQPVLTRRSGKLVFLVVGVALGYVALSEFIADGKSAKHVDGFFGGITYAITHPIGGGFGTAGNSLSQVGIVNDSGANESLAAIFMASVGWVGIVIVGFLLIKGVLAGRSMAGAALTGAILVSLVSETAGGLDATGPLWILAGFALSPLSKWSPVTGDFTDGKTVLPLTDKPATTMIGHTR